MAKTTTPTTTQDMTPEQAMRKRAGRTIGRGVWLAGFKIENPDATRDEAKDAWIEAREDFTKIGMKALKTLEKSGLKVIEDPDIARLDK